MLCSHLEVMTRVIRSLDDDGLFTKRETKVAIPSTSRRFAYRWCTDQSQWSKNPRVAILWRHETHRPLKIGPTRSNVARWDCREYSDDLSPNAALLRSLSPHCRLAFSRGRRNLRRCRIVPKATISQLSNNRIPIIRPEQSPMYIGSHLIEQHVAFARSCRKH